MTNQTWNEHAWFGWCVGKVGQKLDLMRKGETTSDRVDLLADCPSKNPPEEIAQRLAIGLQQYVIGLLEMVKIEDQKILDYVIEFEVEKEGEEIRILMIWSKQPK